MIVLRVQIRSSVLFSTSRNLLLRIMKWSDRRCHAHYGISAIVKYFPLSDKIRYVRGYHLDKDDLSPDRIEISNSFESIGFAGDQVTLVTLHGAPHLEVRGNTF